MYLKFFCGNLTKTNLKIKLLDMLAVKDRCNSILLIFFNRS